MSFPSRAEYESLVYSLLDTYPDVVASTLRLYSTSALTAIVEGSVHLRNGLELRIVEALDFKIGRIQRYSYTVFRAGEKLRWYDSEPHPENPNLASTFPSPSPRPSRHQAQPQTCPRHQLPSPQSAHADC